MLMRWHLWNFPFNIFRHWVTETAESETLGKGVLYLSVCECLISLSIMSSRLRLVEFIIVIVLNFAHVV